MRFFYYAFAALIGAWLITGLSLTAEAQTASSYGTVDAVVTQAYPDSVVDQGTVNDNILAYRVGGDRVQSYVSFDISKLSGTQIATAAFSYRGKVNDAEYENEFGLELRGVGYYNADSLTWNNKPGNGSKLATSTLNTSSARKDFLNDGNKLVDFINNAVRDGATSVHFMIRSTGKDSTSGMWIGGVGNGNFGPLLTYTLTTDNSNYPVKDAVVTQAFPDSVVDQGGINNNILAHRAGGQRVQSYVSFDISSLKGQQVDAAAFSYRGKVNDAAYENEFGLELRGVSDYDADNLTWNNKPGNGSKLATSTLNTSSARKDFINDGNKLVDHINNASRNGAKYVHFLIRSTGKDSTAGMWIGGDLNGSFAPILDYTVAPEVSHYPVMDAIVTQIFPDSVFDQGAVNNNILAYREGGQRVQSFISFDISGLAGQQIETAEVSYRGKVNDAAYENEFGLELRGVGGYDGETVTWNNKPGNGSKLATSLLNTSSARKSFLNDGTKLVDHINNATRSGAKYVHFLIRSTGKDSTSGMWIGGAGNGSFAPILDYSISPEKSCYAAADIVTSQIYPDSVINQGDINDNILAYRLGGQRVQSFVRFDISGLKTEVETATFSYRGKVNDAEFENEFGLRLRQARAPFTDSTTWNNQPGNTRTLANSTLNTSSARKSFINVDNRVADYVNEALRNGQSYIDFVIQSTGKDSTAGMWIGGAGNGSFGPLLEFGLPNLFGVDNDTLTVVEDVFVSQAEPDSNFDAAGADMHVIRTPDSSKHIYLKFDISEAVENVGTVSLMVRGSQFEPPTLDEEFFIDIYGNDTAMWSETTLTWNTKAGRGSGRLARFNIPGGSSQYYPIQDAALTAFVNNAIAAGREEITFIIEGRRNKDFRGWISSKDWQPAMLALDYSTQEASVLKDTYVLEAFPDSNSNGITAMEVAKVTGANREAYLQFDVSEVRSGVVSSALSVRSNQDGTKLDEFFMEVYAVESNDWEDSTLTWNNKPEGGELLGEIRIPNVAGSARYEFSSSELNEYVINAVRNKSNVSFVLRGRDETPETFAWVSDQGWQPAKLLFDYRQVAAAPIFVTPTDQDYIPSVTVELATQTAGGSIYYTLDGTDPTDQSTLYTSEGIMLTDTATIKAVTLADGLAASEIVEATYNVAPVGTIAFTPNPQVEYSDNVTVTLEVSPEDALIVFSLDGGDPLTPYTEPILLQETTTIKARGLSADGNFFGPIAEATYTVVTTVPGTGTGPAGVGAPDNTVAGQPENPLWLAADVVDAQDGEQVLVWNDNSGNDNHAYNTYVDGGDNGIANTGESQKPAPTFIADGVNGKPVMNFGMPSDPEAERTRSLLIDDADNLDGGAGISMFVVFKRNEIFGDFAAIFQKRDITAGNAAQAWVLEFNGGGDPNTMQFVVERQLFLRNGQEFLDDQKYYLVNVEVQGDFQQAIFRVDGEIQQVATFREIIPSVDAPAILGGFTSLNIAEVVQYKKGLNVAQNTLVHNYLAAKYNLELTDGTNPSRLYTNTEYTSNLIGVGTDLYLDGETVQEHRTASGAGLQIDARSGFEAGTYVMAANNGLEITDPMNWDRRWNVETVGAAANVNLFFDYEAVGLDFPADISGLKLWYKGEGEWTDLGLAPEQDGAKVKFAVDGINAGMYALGVDMPGTVGILEDLDASALNVYPNPVTGEALNVEIENEITGDIQVRVYNFVGAMVAQQFAQKTATRFASQLDIESLEAGLYLVEVIQGGKYRTVSKVIKQ